MKSIAYSGTTLENYFTCAVLEKDGTVVFLKSREPRHKSPSLHYVSHLEIAAYHAIKKAKKLNHTPLIIMGLLSREYPDNMLPVDEAFPVSEVWRPNDGVDIASCNEDDFVYKRQNVQDFFRKLNAKDLIQRENRL